MASFPRDRMASFHRFQNGVNGLVNSALREAAHPEQALFISFRSFSESGVMDPQFRAVEIHLALLRFRTRRSFSAGRNPRSTILAGPLPDE